ncbi:MAG TPA: aminotransferase class IV [Bacteroidales bacterium]|nr:aminotransferase class IV [Bacteroidales bacterium]
MSRLFETLRIEADGSIPLLPWHLARMERSCRALFGQAPPNLNEILLQPPEDLRGMPVRCRVDYDKQIRSVQHQGYEARSIQRLALVEADDMEYPHKFAERGRLDGLRVRASADEVIILKRGFLTDASTANIVLRIEDKLLTPDTPLLPGTRRALLLEQGIIHEAALRVEDILRCQEVYLINALRPLGNPVSPLSLWQ